MKDEFIFKIQFIKIQNGYKDDIHLKGTQLEMLGAIEKALSLLNDAKIKILADKE